MHLSDKLRYSRGRSSIVPPRPQVGATELIDHIKLKVESEKLKALCLWYPFYMKHIACTGWGSGGHITPLVSLLEYGLQDSEISAQCKLFRVGEANSLESRLVEQFGETVTFVPIVCGKMRRYRWVQAVRENIRDVFRFFRGCVQSFQFFSTHRIDIVFSKWWYVSLPVCVAAYLMRLPIVIHESDTYGWLANRIVARLATKVFVWFPGTFQYEEVVWQLLSPKLLIPSASFVPKEWRKDHTIVLVMGGSQGAATLFEFLLAWLQTNTLDWFTFVVLLGTKNEHYLSRFATYPNVYTYRFIERPQDMAALYQIADVSITRGSATSLAEQHVFGIKKIVVPLPYTGWNHQLHNAQRYQNTYGDLCIEQKEGYEERLLHELLLFRGYKKSSSSVEASLLTRPLVRIREVLLS